MNKEILFRVVLLSINEKFVDARESIISLFADMFNKQEAEVKNAFTHLPIVLFENLTTDNLKAVKDQLIFLSKLGLDFTITPREVADIPKLKWKATPTIPVIHCPSCGESFCVVRASEFHNIQRAETAKKITVPSEKVEYSEAFKSKEVVDKPDDIGGISAEFDEVEVLSAELESIAEDMGDDPPDSLEEIEEIGSVSEEIEEIGSISEEIEEIEEIAQPEAITIAPKQSTEKEEIIKEIEEIGSVSEEIDSLSKELEGLDEISGILDTSNDLDTEIESIGGISAEFEEIEGVSAEFERICLEGMENDIGSLSAELEEIDGISAEFEAIEAEAGLEKVKEVSETFGSTPTTQARNDLELDELDGISQELEKIDSKKKLKIPNVNNVQTPPVVSYKVVVNFAGSKNFHQGSQFLAQLKRITFDEALKLAEKRIQITVVENVSYKAAEEILKQFQSLNIQGKVLPFKK